jgi:hypothetical protein
MVANMTMAQVVESLVEAATSLGMTTQLGIAELSRHGVTREWSAIDTERLRYEHLVAALKASLLGSNWRE